MKNLTKVLIIFGILFVPFIVKAESYTCSAGGYSCEFNQVSKQIVCVDSEGKPVGEVIDGISDMKQLDILYWVRNGKTFEDDFNNDYIVTQGRCPDFMYVLMNKKREIKYVLFLDNAKYYEKDENGNPAEHKPHEYVELMKINRSMEYYSLVGAMELSGSSGNSTCVSALNYAISDLKTAANKYENNCKSSTTSADCKTIIEEYKKAIDKGIEVSNKYNSEASCKELVSALNTRIETGKSNLNYTPTIKTTTKKDKKYDFSNAGCPLGEEITKDLSGALKVMKILAPIFVFVYTVYDTIVALTHGDAEAEGKKMLQKFLKRMAAALALFAIPVLIDVLMQLFNVWDSTGHCSFIEPELVSPTDQYNGCITECKNSDKSDQECSQECSEIIKNR